MVLTSEKTSLFQQEQTIEQYFLAFNQGDFLVASKLFTEAGQLLPPFEEPLVGREAIFAYLEREATDMLAMPKEMTVEWLAGDRRKIIVKGNVKALIFQVNVAWLFELDAEGNIDWLRVKLLASLQDLANLPIKGQVESSDE